VGCKVDDNVCLSGGMVVAVNRWRLIRWGDPEDDTIAFTGGAGTPSA